MPEIRGFSHVSLSVTDHERSARWYEEVFGFATIEKLDEPDYEESVMLHPSGAILCLQQHRTNPGHPFDPSRTGGDHVAFRVTSREELDEWARRLADLRVVQSPVAHRTYGSVLCLRDTDGIQLELVWRESHP
jgi:glyoxylase I family protein